MMVCTVCINSNKHPYPMCEEQLVYTHYPYFPSGHSTASFAIAIALSVLWLSETCRVKYPWVWVVVAVVGASASAASRLYLKVHWLSEVIAGASIGIAAAIIVWMVYRRRPRVR